MKQRETTQLQDEDRSVSLYRRSAAQRGCLASPMQIKSLVI